MQLFGLVQAKDATTHALKRSLSEDQGGIGLPHPTLILPQQPRYKGVPSPAQIGAYLDVQLTFPPRSKGYCPLPLTKAHWDR